MKIVGNYNKKTALLHDKPEIFLKRLSSGNISLNPEEYFYDVLNIKNKANFIYTDTKGIMDIFPEAFSRKDRKIILPKIQNRLKKANKVLDRIAKVLSKDPHFNPNRKINGENLINIALRNDDKKLATYLMRHKDYVEPQLLGSFHSRMLHYRLTKKLKIENQIKKVLHFVENALRLFNI